MAGLADKATVNTKESLGDPVETEMCKEMRMEKCIKIKLTERKWFLNIENKEAQTEECYFTSGRTQSYPELPSLPCWIQHALY